MITTLDKIDPLKRAAVVALLAAYGLSLRDEDAYPASQVCRELAHAFEEASGESAPIARKQYPNASPLPHPVRPAKSWKEISRRIW